MIFNAYKISYAEDKFQGYVLFNHNRDYKCSLLSEFVTIVTIMWKDFYEV